MLIDEIRFVVYFDPEEPLRQRMINNIICTTHHRSYRVEKTPLRAELECPRTPILINSGALILTIVEGAKTL